MTNTRELRVRKQVALEAARIMAKEAIRDFLVAKRKAALRLGISEARFLPRNIEIKDALADYQRLFHSETQPNQLRALQETAVEAMRYFAAFQPHLTGEVLDGIANQYSYITLHLFADTVEDVALFLQRERIPFKTKQRRLRAYKDKYKEYPIYQFMAEDHAIELVVFPVDGLRQAPCSPVNGKPMGRASLTAVQAMLTEM